MANFSNQIALVTGAGRGIAILLADKGYTVALGRTEEKLRIVENEIDNGNTIVVTGR